MVVRLKWKKTLRNFENARDAAEQMAKERARRGDAVQRGEASIPEDCDDLKQICLCEYTVCFSNATITSSSICCRMCDCLYWIM